MDSQHEPSVQEARDQARSQPDPHRSSRQSGRGQRQAQGSDQGNRASGVSNRPGGTDGGGGTRGQRRGGSSGSQQEGRDGRRRRKDGDRRGAYGYGDTIERCTCLSHHHEMPEIWPVHSRSNLATRRMIEVDRRPNAILFCDGAHGGPHFWPDGEIVATATPKGPKVGPTETGPDAIDGALEPADDGPE